MPDPKNDPSSSSSPDDTWSLAGAKARLSEVIDRAQTGPQKITRDGKVVAVIIAYQEWLDKVTRRDALAELLLASPLRDGELDRGR